MTKKYSISSEEKQYLNILKRLSDISGIPIQRLLNGYWELEVDGIDGEIPFPKVKYLTR